MKPTEISEILRKIGGGAVHDRGQNFLLDEQVVQAMADAAAVGPNSRILEIGPGLGVLTAALLDRGAEVVAVEIDQRLANYSRERFAGRRLRVIENDIRDVSNAAIAAAFADAAGGYAVVANLPYAVTSAVLEKFLTQEPKPQSVTLMVQREVADRVLAGPGDMSSLAVLAQTFGEPRRVMNVPRSSFHPVPRVDSAVIHIRLKKPTELSDFFRAIPPEKYFSVVRAGFAERRRQLQNTLSRLPGRKTEAKTALIEAKLNPMSRPEELTITDWRNLTERLIT